MKPAIAIALFSLLLGLSSTAPADVLLLDAINQEPPSSELPRPTRGMKMDQVRERFGAPVQELPWVGEPPISRWIYDGYTVYFENDTVLRTVINR